MIVTFASEKGGTGKTTIATNIAIVRAGLTSDVLLVDADPQKSSTDFSYMRAKKHYAPALACSFLNGERAGEDLRNIKDKFDDIVVDVGGRDTETLRSILLDTNVLVVPFLASQYDAWAIQRMDELVGEVLKMNDTLVPLAFLNKADTNPRIDLTEEVFSFVKKLNHLKICHTRIGYRVSFRKSVASGQSITEIPGKKDIKSIAEINNLYKEIFEDDY